MWAFASLANTPSDEFFAAVEDHLLRHMDEYSAQVLTLNLFCLSSIPATV